MFLKAKKKTSREPWGGCACACKEIYTEKRELQSSQISGYAKLKTEIESLLWRWKVVNCAREEKNYV